MSCEQCGIDIPNQHGLRKYCPACKEKIRYARHREKILARAKAWVKNNPDRRKVIRDAWKERNPEKASLANREGQVRYRAKFPEKVQAQQYAHRNEQRGDVCEKCGSKEELHFHHTDYVNNKGITLCAPCHVKEHLKLRRGEQHA